MNEIAQKVIEASMAIDSWEGAKGIRLYDLIVQDKEILQSRLLLAGVVHASNRGIEAFLSNLNSIEWLWQQNIR